MGEISVSDSRKWDEAERLLKKKASEIGADAVYIIDSQEDGRGYLRTSGLLLPLRKLSLTAIAIKYKEK